MIEPVYSETLFNYLYSDINGYKVSTAARSNFKGEISNLLYGELPFATFQAIVERLKPKADGVFYDLGSGTGRIVMQAYLMCDFKKNVGVELLDGLHDKALEVLGVFDQAIKPQISDCFEGRTLEFVKADLFKMNYKDADFIFMNHPIKDSNLFLELEEKLLQDLKPGAKIATIIRALKNPRFKSLGSQTMKFSWGDSTVYFFEV